MPIKLPPPIKPAFQDLIFKTHYNRNQGRWVTKCEGLAAVISGNGDFPDESVHDCQVNASIALSRLA